MVPVLVCVFMNMINVGICSTLRQGAHLMDQPSTGLSLKPSLIQRRPLFPPPLHFQVEEVMFSFLHYTGR